MMRSRLPRMIIRERNVGDVPPPRLLLLRWPVWVGDVEILLPSLLLLRLPVWVDKAIFGIFGAMLSPLVSMMRMRLLRLPRMIIRDRNVGDVPPPSLQLLRWPVWVDKAIFGIFGAMLSPLVSMMRM